MLKFSFLVGIKLMNLHHFLSRFSHKAKYQFSIGTLVNGKIKYGPCIIYVCLCRISKLILNVFQKIAEFLRKV
jgi:hypothetical protein